jgi:acyl carrier protein
MVPHRIALLDALPRTATGKVDRKALRPTVDKDEAEITVSRTPLEHDLAVIWRTTLDLGRDIGIDEDFRELGGNSLLSIRLVSEIEKSLKLRLPLEMLGNITTIAEQAALIETAASRIPANWSPVEPAWIDHPNPFAGLTGDELRQMQAYLVGWPGVRAYGGSLFFQLNAGGSLPPLFWCFNGGHEFAALADALGPDQPVFGLRTGNLIMDMTPALQQRNSRRVAVQALPEVLRLKPEGTVFLGGNCQGAAVAIEMALTLQSLGRNVGIVFLMEAIPIHAFHGRVALIFGKDSEYNPFAKFAAPELAWSRRYLRHSVDIIAGRHGGFFREPSVLELAAAVSLRLSQARADTPTYLDQTERRVAWTAPVAVEPFAPGEPRVVRVGARNVGGVAWQPTRESGLRLVARWFERDGTATHAGVAEIDTIWPPGEARDLDIPVAAPLRASEFQLEIDMVEEGVARFAEQGGEALRLEALVASHADDRPGRKSSGARSELCSHRVDGAA